MTPEFQHELGQLLPPSLPYPYFAEREGAWLLRRRLGGPARIVDLRNGPLAGYLNRPGVKEVLAACGDGWLHPDSLLPLADPLEAFGREREFAGDRCAEAAFDIACVAQWSDFSISFNRWPMDVTWQWRHAQLSRQGRNLVMQLNMPSSYIGRYNSLFPEEARRHLEDDLHPVRRDSLITLAWARLDFDRDGDELLIEEVQSDWVRNVRDCLRDGFVWSTYKLSRPQRAFLRETQLAYERSWARAMMLAVLAFAVRELGIRRIWMHQPDLGARLKNIDKKLPPRSLYTDLPKRFGFRPTEKAPRFMYDARSRVLAKWRRSGRPLFWVLDLDARP